MDRYAMYLRKSRADAEEEARGQGETLTRHHDMLRALARKMGVSIADEYREIVSGDTIAARPEIQRLIQAVQAGEYRGVFAADVDRLARGSGLDQFIIAEAFAASNTLIITPYKVYDPSDPADGEFFELKLFFARKEYQMIKRRLQAGRMNATREGLYAGSVPPYGYERFKLPDRKGWSIRPTAEAETVKQIFRWYISEGVGCQVIARRLNEMGIPNAHGQPWRATRIKQLLSQPIYTGSVTWGRHPTAKGKRTTAETFLRVRGCHEPIIDEDTFNAAQERLKQRGAAVKADFELKAFYAGIVKCGICGYAMKRGYSHGIPTIRCSTPNCKTVGMKEEAFERAVIAVLESWSVSIAPKEAEPPKADLRAPLRSERERLQKQLKRARELLEQDRYTWEVYAERESDITGRIAAIDAALNEPEPLTREEAVRRIAPRAATVLEAFQQAESAQEKNALLRSVIDRIIYHKTEPTPHGGNPLELLELDVYPIVEEGSEIHI